MKRRIAFIAAILISATALGGASINYIHAKAENGKVKITWETGDQSGVKEYRVERKSVYGGFVWVGSELATGDSRRYTFFDESAMKSTELVYVYRLKIVNQDGSYDYSKEVSVSVGEVSGVKQTWGGIKSMFR
ncbi:MAG: hypothetical protein GF419_01405 [Ignavibacteriales bacterium]|jgi:hypothetical protein|nr:hypothetical protein [Ignavibacteriales bacterium]